MIEFDAKNPARMNNPEQIRKFIYAGNAFITLVHKNKSFSYRVNKPLNPGGSAAYFVADASLNARDGARYMGVIYRGELQYQHGAKSKISSVSDKAIIWELFYNILLHTNRIHNEVEVWHNGVCGCCAKALTAPKDIVSGLHAGCS